MLERSRVLDFYRQSPRGNVLSRRTSFKRKKMILVGLIILFAYFVITIITQTVQCYQLRYRLSSLEAELETIKQKNVQLYDEIELLHDPEHLELIARRELGLVKPREIIFWVDNKNNRTF